ncbi:MAG: TIGR03943 family putative permease subunit [Thermoguttaceae bacterium]
MHRNPPVDRAASIAHAIKVAALSLVAAFLAFAHFADWVHQYLAPQYTWLPAAGAAALALMTIACLAAPPAATPCCCRDNCSPPGGRSYRDVVRASVCLAILLVPIAFALAVQPREFSSDGMRKRRLTPPRRDVALERAVDWILGRTDARQSPHAPADILPKEPTLLQLQQAAAEADPADLEGRFVTVVGRCDLPEGQAGRRFELYRFLVTCCVADASAISIEVARNDDLRLQPGEWLRIGGMLRFDNPIDPAAPVVHAATISKISEPPQPYL